MASQPAAEETQSAPPGKDEDMAPAFDMGEDEELFDFADCDDAKSEAITSTTSSSDLEMKCFL